MLWISFHQRVFSLNGSDRLNSMRSADGSCTRLRQTEVQNLSLLDEIFNRTSHNFDGHFGIDPAPVREINAVGFKTLQRGLNHFLDVLWSAIQTTRFNVKPEFGCDSDLVTKKARALLQLALRLYRGRRLRLCRRT